VLNVIEATEIDSLKGRLLVLQQVKIKQYAFLVSLH
jgi:hypothetical protein